MKIDISSIVVIIVSLLFIILGGLSKRRKKTAPMKSNLTGKDFLKDTVSIMDNPFDKLEKMFQIPEPTYNPEGESLEVTDYKASSLEVTSDKESQSLEVIVDEVAEYMKEKDKVKSGLKVGKSFDENDLTKQVSEIGSDSEEKSGNQLSLFKDFDDFKKAVIYSEILNRKEY